ncbi:MAG: primosomal protein N', partial [bacterium]
MSKKYAEVVFPQTVNRSFTYAVPPDLKELARIGCRVIAPFGNRKLTGFIVGFLDHTDLTEVKFIQDVLDAQPIFTDDLLELMHWISEYYISPLGDAMKAGIPTNLLQQSKKFVEVIANQPEEAIQTIEKTAPPRQAQILRYVLKSGRISLQQLKRRIGAKSLVSSLNQLEARGLVRMDFAFTTNLVKPKLQKFVKINPDCQILPQQIDELKTRAPQQAACLEFLEKNHLEISLKELMQRLGIYSSSLKSLASKGLITIYEKEILRDYYQQTVPPEIEKLTLNSEQQQSLNAISSVLKKPQFQTFLLHGVTGSGKTQVYIDAIYQVLAQGKDAIVLVPEISLTPQTVARFRSHFKERVAVLHSAMSVGERFDSWRRLRSGAAQVAIGPRSAVFAPLKNIGLIIVDEEHEGSYKQSDLTPRYHARDVAIMRAKILNAVVVLGSATPSAESFYNAKIGKYQLLQLTHRIDHIPLPEVQILDLIKERRLSGKKSPPVFSRLLKQKIEQKLAKKEQTILLLNRRGFSSYIKCKDCGFIANCESCHITLTYHLRGRRLRCHYCGFTKKAPERCPECSGSDILFRGVGTQQVEEELKIAFPQARVVRMDLDTTARKRSHDRILNDFADGKYDILLGT